MATKNGTKGDDTINGTSSNDTINGKLGNDVLNGLAGNDTINGNEGNDRLFGGLGNDTLVGGAGNDALTGGTGKDTLTGGTGADTFKYEARSDSVRGANADLIKDFNAGQGDKVDLTGLGTATLKSAYDSSFSGLQAVFVYSASTNQTTLSYYDGSSTAVFQVKFTGNVHYSEAAFLGISPTPPPPTGPTEGNDNLTGTTGNDGTLAQPIDLLGGNDTYNALAGNDVVFGGAGDDTINGGDGDDTLIFSTGYDHFNGGAGFDTLDFSQASGSIIFEEGDPGSGEGLPEGYGITIVNSVEHFIGSSYDDVFKLDFINNAVVVDGGAGKDDLDSGTGNDTLNGDAGDDHLNGRAGDDTLNGGDGNDTLIGHDGNDTIDGGAGTADVAMFFWQLRRLRCHRE